MENPHLPLNQVVYSEQDLLELLDIERKHLDALRLRKKLPTVWLNARRRVYLAEDVVAWLKALRSVS